MCDSEHPFVEDLMAHGAGDVDTQLPDLRKLSCLVDALRMGGCYELVQKLTAQFVLTTGGGNIEVSWTRDEVVVGSVNFRSHFVSFPIYIAVLFFVNHLGGMLLRNQSRVLGWAKVHHLYSLEFKERGVTLWNFIGTWEKESFVGLPWLCHTGSPALARTNFQFSGQLLLLWVVQRPLFLFLLGPTC